MRSLTKIKILTIAALSLALGGCLVSELALFDAANASARPVPAGGYEMCAYAEGELDDDCEQVSFSISEDGLYTISDSSDDPTEMRFRKIAHRGWLAQLREESDDDGYVYYYARRKGAILSLVMMMCDDLPDNLRTELLAGGFLELQENAEICVMKSPDGVIKAAKYYHHQGAPLQKFVIKFKPTADEAPNASDIQ